MAYQILSTKLYNPPIRSGLIRRPRLVQRLEQGYQAGRCVTLVSAPAGFGKTTLVSEWITGPDTSKPFGWVSLDDGDNDPVRFFAYLVTAIQKVHSEIGRPVLAMLQSSQNANLTDLMEALINEISAAARPFLIVLDDYHTIKNLEVHTLMQLLLKRQPNCLHLIIITREDPLMPLPRMRVQGQLTEVRSRDLRFTVEEAQAFLVECMGIALSSDDIGKLTERTEGWAAGMQLAALALDEFADTQGRQSFIEAFTGSNRLIVDYLISEVLQRQPEATQQFLLNSSILERFCAELADAVVFGETNTSRSQAILNDLEQGNMFLVPLDNQRHWYRYHHLFSEMLYHSLRRSAPDQIPVLHQRASQWFEARGLILEAVQHAAAYAKYSDDWEYARRLLDRHAMVVLFQGQSSLVMGWCQDFPKAYLEKAPEICIYAAWSLVLTFRNDFLDAVEEKLQIAERAIEMLPLPEQAHVGQDGALVPLREWVIGQICVIRSQILLGRFQTYIDPQELIALSLKGLELLPSVEQTTRAICKINLAHAQTMQNSPLEAQKAFEEVLPFMLEAQNYLTGVTSIFYQARLAYYLGDLDRAEMLCREWKERFAAVAAAAGNDNPGIPAARGLDIVLSLLLLEQGQAEEAERMLTRSLELLGWASWMELHGFILLARLLEMRGDLPRTNETLQRMARLGPQHAACAEAFQMWFGVKHSGGDPQVRQKAESWAKRYTPAAGTVFALGIGPYHCDAEYFYHLAWSRVQIALGHTDQAALFVGPALNSAQAHGLLFRIVELSIAQALLLDRAGQPAAALEELGRALEIGARCGYVSVFHDGPELDRLLHQAAEKRLHGAYARQLLSMSPRIAGSEQLGHASGKRNDGHGLLIEPLSEREVEVLRHLANGLTLKEVADRLILSPNTLKAHTQNIYAKLDAHSRIEAVNKAREHGLI